MILSFRVKIRILENLGVPTVSLRTFLIIPPVLLTNVILKMFNDDGRLVGSVG